MDYEQEIAKWHTSLYRNADTRFQLNGQLPLNLALTNEASILYPDRPFVASLKAEDLDLSFLSYLSSQLRQVQGRLNCDLRLINTLKNPHPAGFLQIENGQVYIPQTGTEYKDIQVHIDTDSSRLKLDKLQIRSGEGQIAGYGSVEFAGSGLQTQIQRLDLRLQADHFNAIDTRNTSVVLNGTLRLSNTFKAPQLDGDITVVRSRLYLPSLSAKTSPSVAGEQPMLVALRQDSTRRPATAATDTFLVSRLQNVRGSVKVEIPRNTWLRSPEMNIEISGQINVVISGPSIEPFGTIEIRRGDYNLYGRRFEIDSGTITFRGGKELNPVVELAAQHIFRSADKIKRVLNLTVSGELLEPKLTFLLDNSEIAETDAIAYLVFGRNFEALTQGQRSDMVQNQVGMTGDAFKDLLAGQLAGKVTKAIRNTLDLDVIEFSGDNNWRQATVMVGKYITNDLFVSYQRDIRMGHPYDTSPDQVTMEYEITRSLFFQAMRGDEKNTGFDLIWKKER
jgi:translocation and assembly module TamB